MENISSIVSERSDAITWIIVAIIAIGTMWLNREQWFNFKKRVPVRATAPSTTPKTSQSSNKKDWEVLYKEWWVDGQLLPAIVGVLLLNGILYTLFPTWFTAMWKEYMGSLVILSIALIAGFTLAPKSAITLSQRMGKILILSGFIALAAFAIKGLIAVVNLKGGAAEAAKMVAITITPTTPLPGENLEGKARVEKFWQDNLPPEENPAQMVEIADKESDFNQYELDGVTPLRGRDNPQDTGVMQINKTTWLPFANALGHNIDTWEGNLQMALWIRRHCGADEWTASGLVRTICNKVEVDAPVGDWSEVVPVTRGFNWKSDGPLLIRTSDGREIQDHPTQPIHIGNVVSLSFQSRAKEAVNVTVSLGK